MTPVNHNRIRAAAAEYLLWKFVAVVEALSTLAEARTQRVRRPANRRACPDDTLFCEKASGGGGAWKPARRPLVLWRQNGASMSTTLTSLWLTNSLMPRPRSSRPCPDRFTPPKGRSAFTIVG